MLDPVPYSPQNMDGTHRLLLLLSRFNVGNNALHTHVRLDLTFILPNSDGVVELVTRTGRSGSSTSADDILAPLDDFLPDFQLPGVSCSKTHIYVQIWTVNVLDPRLVLKSS